MLDTNTDSKVGKETQDPETEHYLGCTGKSDSKRKGCFLEVTLIGGEVEEVLYQLFLHWTCRMYRGCRKYLHEST